MTWLHRLPARVRLTLAYAIAMTVLLGGAGLAVYVSAGSVLLDELDTGLRSRAATIQVDLAAPGFRLVAPSPGLVEPTEAFVQIVDRDGAVLAARPDLAPALSAPVVRTVEGPRWFRRDLAGMAGTARILALPASMGGTPVVLVVGGSMSDRSDALRTIAVGLAVGVPLGVLLASAVGWLLAGAALRPVEAMRRQASAISSSELDRRLTLPRADDEFRRLATTLNDMLARLETSLSAERRFLDHASHELRTPLTALQAELDLALMRPRDSGDLLAAVRSASAEAERLTRIADDLLVLARARGRLPIRRETVPLRPLLTASARLFAAGAEAAGVRIDVRAPEVDALLDPVRVRQALDNLLDNAIRHGPPGSTVTLAAECADDVVRITVDDEGDGFPDGFAAGSFEPFARAPGNGRPHDGAGLGLAIVQAVAQGHGGTVTIESPPGAGARVVLDLPGAATVPAEQVGAAQSPDAGIA